MALLTEHDVVNMRFKEPRSLEEGYDQDEVDFFLDEVAETIAQLTTSSRTLPRRSTTPPNHGMRRICNPRDAASSERFSASSSLSTLARKI